MDNSESSTPVELFEKNRYIQIKNLVEGPLLRVANRYALMKAQTGQMFCNDKQVPGTPSLYAEPIDGIDNGCHLALCRTIDWSQTVSDLLLFSCLQRRRRITPGILTGPHVK